MMRIFASPSSASTLFALIKNESTGRAATGCRPLRLDEFRRDRREKGITGAFPMDNGQVDPVGHGKRLPIDILPAADENLVGSGASRQGLFQCGRHAAPLDPVARLPGKDDVFPPRQRTAYGP